MDDVGAVMAEEGLGAALLGVAEGGPAAMLYAATFPDRVPALVLVDTFARFMRAADYPVGLPPERVERFVEAVQANWATRAQLEFMADVDPATMQKDVPELGNGRHGLVRADVTEHARDELAWG